MAQLALTVQHQERLVAERLQLLTRLSTFLPPPLASLLDPSDPNLQGHSASDIRFKSTPLDLLKFWNVNANAHAYADTHNHFLAGKDDAAERWWSIEELGEGARVVRSKGQGGDREVWVLRIGDKMGKRVSDSTT